MLFFKILLNLVAFYTLSILNLSTITLLSAGEYYVAPDGNDLNSGTIDHPWQTIHKANLELQPGDIVYIREGHYKETIRPSRSGREQAPITYSQYANEVAVVHSRPEGVQLSGCRYIIIQELHFENCTYFVRSYPEGFDHCIIQNCVMKKQTGWCGIEIGDGCSYNKILDNYIDSFSIEGDCIHIGRDEIGEQFGAKHNLVANNECTGAMHSGICCAGDKTQFNIIRNNYVHDIGDINIVTGALTSWVLIEDNRCHNSGIDPDGACAIQIRSEKSIVRRNILTRDIDVDIEKDAAALELQATIERPYVRQNKIYHNVIYNFNQGNTRWDGIKLAVYDTNVQFGTNIFKNNIIYKNGIGNSRGYQIAYSRVVNTLPDDLFDGNLIRGNLTNENVIYFFEYNKQNLTLEQAKQRHPAIFLTKNIDTSPLFINENNFNFHLRESSPCIDGGSFLTKTMIAGSGNQIQVKDAGYFCDGWGITDGDIIRVASQKPAKIVRIDYDNNILIIDQSLNWQQGDPVSLNYFGEAPDIGAYEYFESGGDALAPFPPQNVKVINP